MRSDSRVLESGLPPAGGLGSPPNTCHNRVARASDTYLNCKRGDGARAGALRRGRSVLKGGEGSREDVWLRVGT